MGTGLGRLFAAIDDVAGEDFASGSDPVLLDRLRELERARRALDAATVATIAVVHQRGAAGYDGATSTGAWMRTRLRMSLVEASGLVEAARHLAEVPVFAEAFRDGRVSLAHVRVAAKLARTVGAERAPEAVEALLGHALEMCPSDLKHVADRIRELVRPDLKDKPKPQDRYDRSLFVSSTFEGRGVVQGDLAPEATGKWLTAMNTRMGVPAADDDRAPAERRHDALEEILDFYLTHADLPLVGGERPHLSALVHASDLQEPGPGRKRRLKPKVRFDGEDALTALYAYLDGDPTPIPPDWIDDPDPDGWNDDATIDWDTVLTVWADEDDQIRASQAAIGAPGSGTVFGGGPEHANTAGSGPEVGDGAPGISPELLDAGPLPEYEPNADTEPMSLSELVETVFGQGSRRSRMPAPGTGGVTEWGGRLTCEAMRRIACDAGINRIVLGPEDVPLSAGRQVRLVRASMRRVLVARDGGCRFPGCDRPPAWTQAHHITAWADGGPTDVDNLLLLCSHHHHRVHDDGWTLDFDGHTVTVTRPDGTILNPP